MSEPIEEALDNLHLHMTMHEVALTSLFANLGAMLGKDRSEQLLAGLEGAMKHRIGIRRLDSESREGQKRMSDLSKRNAKMTKAFTDGVRELLKKEAGF